MDAAADAGVFEATSDACFVLDGEHVVVRANAAAVALFGDGASGTLAGVHIGAFVPAWESLFTSGGAVLELEVRCHDEDLVPVRARCMARHGQHIVVVQSLALEQAAHLRELHFNRLVNGMLDGVVTME